MPKFGAGHVEAFQLRASKSVREPLAARHRSQRLWLGLLQHRSLAQGGL